MRFKVVKSFKDKKITIRLLSKSDLKHPEKFQNFINSLIKEGAQITANKKKSLKEEIDWLKGQLTKTKKHQLVSLVAEYSNIIVGSTAIYLREGRESHVGEFGIAIRKGYRGIGLGSYLLDEIIKLAKIGLKPFPKIIRSSVVSTNKPAINLYKKYGFKKVAEIPDQLEFQGKLVDEVIMLKFS